MPSVQHLWLVASRSALSVWCTRHKWAFMCLQGISDQTNQIVKGDSNENCNCTLSHIHILNWIARQNHHQSNCTYGNIKEVKLKERNWNAMATTEDDYKFMHAGSFVCMSRSVQMRSASISMPSHFVPWINRSRQQLWKINFTYTIINFVI